MERAVAVLRQGGVIAAPTDTQYGLLADAANRSAVERVRIMKGLADGQPILLLAPDRSWVGRFHAATDPEASRAADALMKAFWPGPLTLILPARAEVPVWVRGDHDSIAMRLPGPGAAAELVRRAGFPVTATSANRHGEPPSLSGADVEAVFGDELDLILDGGAAGGGPPSTLIDVTSAPPRLVRCGAIAESEVRPWLETKRSPS